jgi:hypothetical protein
LAGNAAESSSRSHSLEFAKLEAVTTDWSQGICPVWLLPCHPRLLTALATHNARQAQRQSSPHPIISSLQLSIFTAHKNRWRYGPDSRACTTIRCEEKLRTVHATETCLIRGHHHFLHAFFAFLIVMGVTVSVLKVVCRGATGQSTCNSVSALVQSTTGTLADSMTRQVPVVSTETHIN